MSDGITADTIKISDIDAWFYYNCQICILYGAQLGACLIMFIVTAVLTKETKRRTPVYILNLLSLALGFLRSLLLALYSVSPWTEFYAYFSFDFNMVPRSAYSISIAGTVIPLLLTISVNSSLVLQAHAVSKVMKRTYVYLISGLSILVLLLAVGFRFAEVVTNSMAIMSAGNYFSQAWITTGALATETISIWFFSIIFTGKLIWTVQARKNLGFHKWGYIQILAAMGGCTMIIPCKFPFLDPKCRSLLQLAIFAVLEFVTPNVFPEAGTLALTLVALLLPLSSLWASMVTIERDSSFNISQLWGSKGSLDTENRRDGRKTFDSRSSAPTSRLEFPRERKDSLAPITPNTTNSVIEHVPKTSKQSRDSTEIDLEMMGVRVDCSYSVHSGKGYGGVGMA